MLGVLADEIRKRVIPTIEAALEGKGKGLSVDE
jgi:hypothetical protein